MPTRHFNLDQAIANYSAKRYNFHQLWKKLEHLERDRRLFANDTDYQEELAFLCTEISKAQKSLGNQKIKEAFQAIVKSLAAYQYLLTRKPSYEKFFKNALQALFTKTLKLKSLFGQESFSDFMTAYTWYSQYRDLIINTNDNHFLQNAAGNFLEGFLNIYKPAESTRRSNLNLENLISIGNDATRLLANSRDPKDRFVMACVLQHLSFLHFRLIDSNQTTTANFRNMMQYALSALVTLYEINTGDPIIRQKKAEFTDWFNQAFYRLRKNLPKNIFLYKSLQENWNQHSKTIDVLKHVLNQENVFCFHLELGLEYIKKGVYLVAQTILSELYEKFLREGRQYLNPEEYAFSQKKLEHFLYLAYYRQGIVSARNGDAQKAMDNVTKAILFIKPTETRRFRDTYETLAELATHSQYQHVSDLYIRRCLLKSLEYAIQAAEEKGLQTITVIANLKEGMNAFDAISGLRRQTQTNFFHPDHAEDSFNWEIIPELDTFPGCSRNIQVKLDLSSGTFHEFTVIRAAKRGRLEDSFIDVSPPYESTSTLTGPASKKFRPDNTLRQAAPPPNDRIQKVEALRN